MTGFAPRAGRVVVLAGPGCVVNMEARRSVLGRLLGPLCCGLLLFVLMLLDGSASSETYAVDAEVKDESNVTCLYAKWMMNFSITYEANNSEYKNKAFTLPENVKYDGSSCGDQTSGPLLAIEFGEGNLWSISFTKTGDTYQGNITFIYNTNDVKLFPDAKRKGPIVTSANYPVHPVKLHTIYTCSHVDSFEAGNVTSDLWNISLQAFLQNGSLSTEYTHCDNDVVDSGAATTTEPTTTTSEPTTMATEPTAGTSTSEPTTTMTSEPTTTTEPTTSEPATTTSETMTTEPTAGTTTTEPTTTITEPMTMTTEPMAGTSTSEATPATSTSEATPATSTSEATPATSTSEATPATSTSEATPPTSTSEATPPTSTSELMAAKSTSKLTVAKTISEPMTTVTTATTEPTTTSNTTEPTTTTNTAEPTTTNSTNTTASNTTISTAATVNATILSPSPLPTAEAGEKPVTGNYSVSDGAASCLLASMGLQLNVSKEQSPWIINIQPNTTEATGGCGKWSANLRLNNSNSIIIDFFFAVKNVSSGRFYLKGVNITIVRPSNGSLHAENNDLSYWEGSLGSSYMCRKEDTLIVAEGYQIKTFDLRVQPFRVKENKYSTAQECSLDDDTILIPIAVGTALIILIVIIVFAYIVGRRKGYAGYQTL